MYARVRNVLWAVLLLPAAFISCSQQDDVCPGGVADGKEITTTVTVKAPEVFETRSVPDIYQSDYDFGAETGIHAPAITQYLGTSGMPSIGNVDLGDKGEPHDGHPLTYTVAIYVQKNAAVGETNPTYTLVERQWQEDVKATEAYFNFRLIKGQTYRIVAYADFSGKAKADLENIAVAPTEVLNDELADAFFVSQDFEADDHLGAVLKRPFAKLRLIAHDLDRFSVEEKFKITKVEVKYTKQRMLAVTNFNALTGDFNYNPDATAADYTVKARPVSYVQEYEDDKTVKKTRDADGNVTGNVGAAVFTMYLPANFGTPAENEPTHGKPINEEVVIPQSWMYPFDVTVSYVNEKGEVRKIERSYQFDIPVKRNWLTTVDVENFWTTNTGVTVSVNPDFEGFIEWKPETHFVTTEEELLDAVKAIEGSAEKEGRIVLGENIEIKGEDGIRLGYYLSSKKNGLTNIELSTKDSVTLYLDLNGHKLSAGKSALGTSQALINIYGPHTLIIDDTNEKTDGIIESTYWQTIISWRYGANIIINGGKILSHDGAEVVYLADPLPYIGGYVYKEGQEGYGYLDDEKTKPYLKGKPSTLTINGGWFESVDATYPREIDRVVINVFNGGRGWPSHPKTNEGSDKAMGYGNVHINGGSFVEFNPEKGDNVSGNYSVDDSGNHVIKKWVDDTKYKVLTSTVNGKTVYTVVHKDYDGQTPEIWKQHE